MMQSLVLSKHYLNSQLQINFKIKQPVNLEIKRKFLIPIVIKLHTYYGIRINDISWGLMRAKLKREIKIHVCIHTRIVDME